MRLPPRAMPAMCPDCGEPVTPYTLAVQRFNFYGDASGYSHSIANRAIHIPTLRNPFCFSCGFSR